jgi:hypothetical protein
VKIEFRKLLEIGGSRNGFLPRQFIAPPGLGLQLVLPPLIARRLHFKKGSKGLAGFRCTVEVTIQRRELIPRHDSEFLGPLRIRCQLEVLDGQVVLAQRRIAFSQLVMRVADGRIERERALQ